jgi:hypothetical protein
MGKEFLRANEGVWLARSQFLVPSGPIRSALLLLDCREQGKILKPERLRAYKGVELRLAAIVPVSFEMFECLSQPLQFQSCRRGVVHISAAPADGKLDILAAK